MSEWLRRAAVEPQEETFEPPPRLRSPNAYLDGLRDGVADIIGTAEAQQIAGFTNRGSIPYHQQKNGFPQPVKQLQGGTRLWSRSAVEDWKRTRDSSEDSVGGSNSEE